MPPKNKRKASQLSEWVMTMSSDAGTAILPFAEQLKSKGEYAASRTLRKRAYDRLHRCDEWDSPYGAVIENLPVVGSAGTLYVKAVNTFAFLFIIFTKAPAVGFQNSCAVLYFAEPTY